MILFLYNQYVVNALLHNSFSNRIYPGKTQILLTINVDTRLQSCELSAPVLLSTILYITQLSNHNMGMTELYISTYIELVNRNTWFTYLLLSTFYLWTIYTVIYMSLYICYKYTTCGFVQKDAQEYKTSLDAVLFSFF